MINQLNLYKIRSKNPHWTKKATFMMTEGYLLIHSFMLCSTQIAGRTVTTAIALLVTTLFIILIWVLYIFE